MCAIAKLSSTHEVDTADTATTTIAATATAWARSSVPVAGEVGSGGLEVACCEQQYRDAVQNLRGLIGRLRNKQAQQRTLDRSVFDPTQAQYQILGMEGISPVAERPLLVTGREQQLLTRLCAQVVERLSIYVHSKLLTVGMSAASSPTDAVAQVAPNMRIKHLVVGMSGGPDSTLALVLMVALQQSYGYRVTAVHCIHGLDPDDAIWLQHNQQLCASLGVTLKTPRLNIVYGEGRSPEEVSRAERYQALLRELQADSCLVLGHQADDQVENLLLALKRGAGPQGLGGMRLLTQDERGLLLRPLLDLHKSEIEQILTQLGFAFVYDLSNSYLKFERNFVRLKVLPLLRERFAGVDRAILRSQQLCAYEHDLAERLVAERIGSCLATDVYGAEGQCFDFAAVDVGDRPLLIMLLRSWVQQELGFHAELNLLERCYELMLKPHDRNGEVLFPPSAYAASTFLHYLCLYRPLSEATMQALASLNNGGAVPLSLAPCTALATAVAAPAPAPAPASAPIHASVASVPASTITAATNAPLTFTGQVVSTARIGELAYHLIALDPCIEATVEKGTSHLSPLTVLKVQTTAGTFDIQAHSYFVVSPDEKTLYLHFAYAQSLKLKPRWRTHSRECKKLMLECKVSPWIRAALPLVCTSSGKVLACANLWAQDPQVEVKVTAHWVVPNSFPATPATEPAPQAGSIAAAPLYLALAISRES